jgi:hypothetical protein|uniref:Predicted gene, 61592 n=1 Tax=Mus musculus TaxID=10090 RepID=A0ABA7IW14_MOUSE
MSLNEEKDGEDPSKLSMAQNVQDELVRVIHMSLNNIASQVDNLNKHAEGILGALSKEVSCRYDTLHDRVTQLNNNITIKDTEKEFPLQAKKSKSSRSAGTQTDLEYPFIPLPDKIRETHDASVQTSPLCMSVPYFQDNPQVVPVLSFQEDTETVQIPYYKDDSDDLAIPPCQENEQDVEIPCCVASDQGLAASHDISYYFKTCEEKLVAGVNEQVQERFRKKNQRVDHPCEPKCIHKFTLMENDITVGHIPPTYLKIPHSHENPSTTECSAFSTYPIKEISKALTQAVEKVFSSPSSPQKKEVKYMKNSKPYVRYGVGKREMNLQSKVQIRPEPEVSMSRKSSVTPPPLRHDWLTVLKNSNTECPVSNVHSQTQFPSPVLRTSETKHLYNYFQTSPDMGVKTTEEDNEFQFLTLPSECLEIEDDSPEEDNIIEKMPLMSFSPVSLRRTETKSKDSDLLVHTSFVQSPSSLDHLSSKTLFPHSPRLSASNSPRPSAISSPRFSHQSQTKCIFPTYSKTSNSALPSHSTLETYQSSFPLSDSFLQASVHSARCQSAYSPKHSVSPRRFDPQSSRFPIPSSGKIYIDRSAKKLVPPSPKSSSLKSKSFTLQSLFSFPKSTSPTIPNPQTLSVFQYSADPMSPDPKQPSVFNKERGTFLDSITKGVLLRKTEEHCILKAQIEISKK